MSIILWYVALNMYWTLSSSEAAGKIPNYEITESQN